MFQKKRILAAGLALVLAFSLTACNGKNADGNSGQKNAGSNAEELAPEFSYVAKYQELSENFNMGEIVFNGNNAYSAKTDYANGSSLKIVKTTIENGNLGQENTLFELQDFSLNGFAVDSSDNVYLINAVYPQMDEEAPMDNFAFENSAKNYLVKYNNNEKN